MASEETFRSPGYKDREFDFSESEQAPFGVAAGVIGTAERGPAFIPVTVGSITDFNAKFGNLDPNRFGPYAVNEFLKHRQAVTYLRVLGAGANDDPADISRTRSTGQVRNAGFVVTSSATTTDGAAANIATGHVGAVQFICAKHSVSTDEAYGMPMFTDNDSVDNTSPNLVRATILLASSSRVIVADGDAHLPTAWATLVDSATLDSTNHFKLIISSSNGENFSIADGLPGLRVYSASLDPTSDNYIGKLLNTDPDNFPIAEHYLYSDFAVDAQVASASSDVGAIAVLSGTTGTSATSGDATMEFRDVFGHYDTRYAAPQTPFIISQPFGKKEFNLFKLESIDDGEFANTRYKVSITNVRKSTDPKSKFGTFSVEIRTFDDNDLQKGAIERFPECSLDPTAERYVARVIGDRKAYYNFDAERDSEKRIVVSGRYPNNSRLVRVVMNSDVENGKIPQDCLPFGFRGYPVLNTNGGLTDSDTSLLRLGGVGIVNGVSASVVPPIPFRFKVTRGATTGSGWAGNPGPTELANASLTWGVKFERTTSALNANRSIEKNRIIEAFTRLQGIEKLDAVVTGSAKDTFNANKFTLARVALSNTSLSHLTASISEHMREAAYLRNATPDPSDYKLTDGVIAGRIGLGTLMALTSSVEFNRFSPFAGFTLFMHGGFDGLNILDKNARYMTDRATSLDSGGGAEGSFVSPGLNNNSNGTELENNMVQSYRVASQIMTDEVTANINLLAIPGIRDTFVTDFVAGRVRKYGLAMYVMDPVQYDDDNNRLFDDDLTKPDTDKTSDQMDSRAIDNNYIACYFPDVQIEDSANNRRVMVPPSVAAYGAIAFNDRVAYPWFAPAGFNRAALDFVRNVDVRLNKADRDRLQDARINPVATFPREGFVIFGQRTMQASKSALDRVNVRRLLVDVKRQLKGVAERITFEPNNPATRQRFVSDATLRLGLVQARAGIERFEVTMDETNNTREDIENNRLNGRIEIVPTRVAENIVIDFIVTNAGVEFR